jgi:membrane protein
MDKPSVKAASASRLVRRSQKLLQEDIWHHSMVEDRTLRGRLYAVLRVLSITERGIMTKKMFSQSAALSYASLMSLGPIITLAIMISSFVLKDNSEQNTIEMLNRVVTYIAPTTSVQTPEEQPTADGQTAVVETANVNKDLVNLLNNFVASAHSRSVGTFGLGVLIFICIQMMISIENNFNNIWGVRRGRNLLRRIVLYWTVFSLGVLAAFTTGTVLFAAMLGTTKVQLPWGLGIIRNFTGLGHALGFVCLTLLLAVFYRFIPNTQVRWRPAFVGGVVVATCLILNNYFSFLYVSTVLNKQSLYGSVGIIPILMFGLYVFWTMVLFGGVLTYAVQNAGNVTADRLWNQVSPRTRRLLNLAAFLQIARSFLRGQGGPTSEEIAQTLRVPAALLNEGLGRLTDLHLVTATEVTNKDGEVETRYQPGRPLHKLTLGKFHLALDLLGNAEGDETILATDPLLPQYLAALGRFENGPLLELSFAELLKDEKSGLTNIPFRV